MKKLTIRKEDYIKAIKIADRELSLSNGFKSTNVVFKNKKAYIRNSKHRQPIINQD